MTFVVPDNKPYSVEAKEANFQQSFNVCSKFLTQKRTCLDIGGHVGIFAALYAKHFKTVHTFEPIPSLYAMMLQNIAELDHVHPHNNIVSDTDGTAEIFENPRNTEINVVNSGWSRQLVDKLFGPKGKYNVIPHTIATRSIDSFEFDDVDLIKIDTESYIIPILEGATETIKRCRPVCIVEDHTCRGDVLNFFKRLNYQRVKSLPTDTVYQPKRRK